MKQYFDDYIKSIFQIKNDLKFWKHFLEYSINTYKEQNPENRWIYDAGFSIYDLPASGAGGWLKMSQESFKIEIKDLHTHSDEFFSWVRNLAIIRVYNSLELLLLRIIWHSFFFNLFDPVNSKKDQQAIISSIINVLKLAKIEADTKNNRLLISFLKYSSNSFSTFSIQQVRIDMKTSWEQMFEFVSILRNIIAHHGMTVTKNTHNEISSKAKSIYERFFLFDVKPKGEYLLRSKSGDDFLNFVAIINDFAGNTVKYIANEPDLKFLKFY